MSYVNSILMKDEKVVYGTKPHWVVFSNAILWLVASLFLYLFGPHFNLTMIMFNYPLYQLGSFILFILAIYMGVGAGVYYKTAEFAITNRRIIMKRGLIERNSLEILLQKVESVQIEQTILGRILSFGTIVIKGVGGTQDPFDSIPDPGKFREIVQQQTESALLQK